MQSQLLLAGARWFILFDYIILSRIDVILIISSTINSMNIFTSKKVLAILLIGQSLEAVGGQGFELIGFCEGVVRFERSSLE